MTNCDCFRKWLLFCRSQFQMHFLKTKCLIVKQNFIDICFEGLIDKQWTWTNDGLVSWHLYAPYIPHTQNDPWAMPRIWHLMTLREGRTQLNFELGKHNPQCQLWGAYDKCLKSRGQGFWWWVCFEHRYWPWCEVSGVRLHTLMPNQQHVTVSINDS